MLGLLAGAAAAAPFVLSSFRNNRRFDEDTPLPMPKDLSDPLPPVLEFTSAQPQQMAGMDNLHFGEPLKEGPLGAKVRMQRAGLSAGPDVTSPNITTPGSNLSVIDGKPLTDLSGKHVNDLRSESHTPGIDLP